MKNKWMRFFICAAMCLGIALSAGACGGNTPDNPDDPNDTKPVEAAFSQYNGITGLEKDYVNMWYPGGLTKPNIYFQAKNYAINFNTSTGKIENMGAISYEGADFVETDFTVLPALFDMSYEIEQGGAIYLSNGTVTSIPGPQNLYARMIESGRYMQKIEILRINYEGQEDYYGRLEIAASSDYFALSYGVFNQSLFTRPNANLTMRLDFGGMYPIVEQEGDYLLTVRNESGEGFTFVVPQGDTSANATKIEYNGGVAEFSQDGFQIGSKDKYHSFGIVVIPSVNASLEDGKKVLAQGQIEGAAVQIYPNQRTQQETRYDAQRGVYVINADNMMGKGFPYQEKDLDCYDRLSFSLTNPTNYPIRVPVVFEKKPSEDYTYYDSGFAPVLRDAETLEPTGIQVQISKNWHSFDSQSHTGGTAVEQYLREGEDKWGMCYVVLEIPAGESVEYEYTVAYGNWGGVMSVSHAQLSLIGYNGDWTWDQSALGSWGESITYDPDRVLGRSLIDDCRVVNVTDAAGSYSKYSWGDNVGGADFLWYNTLVDGQITEQRIINQHVNYITQGPNMTSVLYSGVTSDGAIATNINIRMGRTDDVVRAYYTMTYTFLEDVTFSQLAFFNLNANNYSNSNNFFSIAYGDDKQGVAFDSRFYPPATLYNVEGQTVGGTNAWFLLYDNQMQAGNKMMIVRNYSANINGNQYDLPAFSIGATSDSGRSQPTIELSVPKEEGKTVTKGSTVDMTVEFVLLPNLLTEQNQYYGTSDYLLATMDLFNTAQSGLQQAQGNTIAANASVGTILGNYPLEIRVAEGDVAAQFTMTGGLGYTPLVFSGLPDAGYELQKNVNGTWEKVDQTTTTANDFYQVYYNPSSGRYQMVFNVKNSSGTDFRIQNEYRLIKK